MRYNDKNTQRSWARQIEKEDLSDKTDIIVGNKLEAPLRDVMRSRGYDIQYNEDLLEHPDYDFWTGYVDGYNEDTVYELKTSIDFQELFAEHDQQAVSFDALSDAKRKEYITWIEKAKTEPTKTKRIQTMMDNLLENKSLHWKYNKK